MTECVLLSVLEFEDGTCSVQPLHRGNMESCEIVADRIHALSYSGGKMVSRSYLKLVDADDFDELAKKITEGEGMDDA